MGRSRVGGTLAKIRGAVGSTVYQISKDPQGKYYQKSYVRQYTRLNNNTNAQAMSRMIMGQIQRMFHFLPQVITGAFATIPRGIQSFSHFAKINYPLLKQDIEEHPIYWGRFAWRFKYEMDAPIGPWKLTEGVLPDLKPYFSEIRYTTLNYLHFGWIFDKFEVTYRDLLEAIGAKVGDSIYIPIFWAQGYEFKPQCTVSRFRFMNTVPLDSLLTEVDLSQVISYTGDFHGYVQFPYNGYQVGFIIDADGSEPPYVLASFALIHYRPTDGFPLFSSSTFSEIVPEFSNVYLRHKNEEVIKQWREVKS